MKKYFIGPALILSAGFAFSQTRDLGREYLDAWQRFYPSQALEQGMHTAIFEYEDRSPERIGEWLAFNREIIQRLSDTAFAYTRENRIDARLLLVQARSEADRWEKTAPHQHSLQLYTSLIVGAATPVLEARYLNKPEKAQLLCKRLRSVENLCEAATRSLTAVDRDDLDQSLRQLEKAADFYEKELPEAVAGPACHDFALRRRAVAAQIRDLVRYAATRLAPNAREASPILGRAEYARRLALYTDSDLTPEDLAAMALEEIKTARELMNKVSQEYLRLQYPGRPLPADVDTCVQLALADMEKDAPVSGEDYRIFWQELADAAVRFIEEHDIATLPEYQTLRIVSAPESAGPAARIGWVDSAPPFAPNPVTTLYLPSIPDTFPEQDRRDFWSSFNKPFNRMIVIHELFPGHYMQIKTSRETPHPIRMLFPYGVYIEGWATFCERVLLDAGWEKERPLTFLAHLRKRLENANRAYTSVQVHCNGWSQDQLMDFSVNTSRLAPQFAKSLWGRVTGSPMQVTSYFLGGRQFTDLLANEKARLGDRFVLRDFMDAVMREGPVPIDEFPAIFEAATPK